MNRAARDEVKQGASLVKKFNYKLKVRPGLEVNQGMPVRSPKP
jgi:hypothetical protein